METVLASHLIPHGIESGLWADDFERFLEQRLELVGQRLSRPQAQRMKNLRLFPDGEIC